MDAAEVAGRRFRRALAGYDRGEVERFLAQVALELARRERRIAELETAAAPARPVAPASPPRRERPALPPPDEVAAVLAEERGRR